MSTHTVSIDQKEIRGVTARHIALLIVSLFSILTAVMGTYYSTANKIDKTQDDIQSLKGSKELEDAQIKALNLNMQVLEIRIVKLETQMGLQQTANR
jgi:hypothetical protein